MAGVDQTALVAHSTAHDQYPAWVRAAGFRRFWHAGGAQFEARLGSAGAVSSLAGARTNAPLGGEETGPPPTDRSKDAVKRSLLTAGQGVPRGLAVARAHPNAMKLVRDPSESSVAARPAPVPEQAQGLGLDKGYHYQEYALS